MNSKQAELESLQKLFNNFLQRRNVKALYKTRGKFNLLDAIAVSADTLVSIETKNRSNFINDYSNTFIEKVKVDAFKKANTIFGASAFYIMHFYDFILVFDLTQFVQRNDLGFYQRRFRKNNQTFEYIDKYVVDLEYHQAQYVIDANTYELKNINDVLKPKVDGEINWDLVKQALNTNNI